MTGVNQASLCVIVTGGGRGIGAAVSMLLARQGWRVAVVDQDLEAAKTVSTEILESGAKSVAVAADVSSVEGWRRVVHTSREELGPIGGLVSSAAHNSIAPIDVITEESWARHLGVNLTGALLGVQTCLPDLQATEGSVVLVSSVHAGFGLPLHAAYAASKAGLEGLARQLAAELAPVRVNAVRVGPVLTAAWDGIGQADRDRSAAATALGRLGNPEEVSEPIAFLLGSGANFITGSVLTVDGGWSVTKDSS